MAKLREVKGQTDIFEGQEVEQQKRGRGRPPKEIKPNKQSFFIGPENDTVLTFVSANFGMTKSRFIDRLSETLFKDLSNAIALEELGSVQDRTMTKDRARKLLSMFEYYGFEKVEVEERNAVIERNNNNKNKVKKAQEENDKRLHGE